MLFKVLLFLFFSLQLFAKCRIPALGIAQLNEQGIRQYIQQVANSQISIDEFACCLPSVFQNHYIVAHSSFAGQDSIPQSPRVIMTNLQSLPGGKIQLPSAFFSINGGHSSLRQTKSVELVLVDRNTGKSQFFDIDFSSGSARMGPANPPLCMACHESRSPLNSTGPHLIFDGPFVWPRFVQGLRFLPQLEKHPTLPEFDSYIQRLQTESLKALNENPRFQCLSQKVPEAGFLNVFDQAIQRLNVIKTSSDIVKSKDYNQFKYAIFAASFCPSMLKDLDCQLSNAVKNCSQWIHPRRLSSMNHLTNIFGPIQKLNHTNEMDLVALKAFNSRKAEILQQIQFSQNEKVSFEFRKGFLDPKLQILPKNLLGLRSPLLRKYALDNELRGSQVNLLQRFLFESRGLPIAQWSTDVVAGYQRSGIDPQQLIQFEAPASPLRKALRLNPQQTCEALRGLSWKATQSL